MRTAVTPQGQGQGASRAVAYSKAMADAKLFAMETSAAPLTAGADKGFPRLAGPLA
jgi:hypothetical protein